MIVKIDTNRLSSEHFNNVLDTLDKMSDSEVEILETLCNVIITERRVFGKEKILNEQITHLLNTEN